MIYLDNSATTQIDKRVVEEMLPFLLEEYGNPTSKYYDKAVSAKKAIEKARSHVAELLNCESEEIIFNSGSSEGNNHVIKGVADYYKKKGKHLITTEIEHKSVLQSFAYLEKSDFKVSYLKPDSKGKINIEELKSKLSDETILVSIMWANNEIGTLNNIKELGDFLKSKKIFFHVDATQVVGKIKIDLKKVNLDFLTLSAHKINGPKGSGALFIRNNDLGIPIALTPLIHGGDQERGDRGGTHSVHNIVGLGKACELCYLEQNKNIEDILELEKYLINELNVNFKEKIYFNGDIDDKVPGIISVVLKNVNNELLIKKLRDNVAISTGSACNIKSPSYVLKSIGKNENEIMNTIRISIGKYNTKEEMKKFVGILKNCLGA